MGERMSEKQQGILEFVGEYIGDNGYPPSMREICAATGISSTSVVSYNLDRLEESGYIVRDRDVSRGLRLAGAGRRHIVSDRTVHLPLLGRIVAGEPVPVPSSDFALMGDETIEVSRDILGDLERLYALEVEGNSMVDALVNDGDIVIMQYQSQVENGEMAAVWLRGEGEVTLKHFYQEPSGRIRLQPANPTMDPIYVDDPSRVEVQGKVVMVIRKLD
ncbi:MAG: transcriptional repressor LexA [Chloroflexota bacterium]|nr:transcriptional repressor LexA [Chloroflexota bacterium]